MTCTIIIHLNQIPCADCLDTALITCLQMMMLVSHFLTPTPNPRSFLHVSRFLYKSPCINCSALCHCDIVCFVFIHLSPFPANTSIVPLFYSLFTVIVYAMSTILLRSL